MKKRIVIITMIICTACLLLWRFLPRSFAGIDIRYNRVSARLS